MPDTEKLLNLNPDDIYIGDNVRFALKPARLERLKEEIIREGEVKTPIEVYKMSEPIDGKSYAVLTGTYRTTAVADLNASQNAGLALPARVVSAPESEAQRLRRQVAENNERENMSPMDVAVTIKKMMDAGLSNMEIRDAFAVPGGKKGLKFQPASNAYINKRLGFLEFPKDLQRKVHEGIVPASTASELLRYPKDKWSAILEAAEKERIKGIEEEEKEEAKLLAAQKKAAEEEAAATKAQTELEAAKTAAESAEQVLSAKQKELGEAFQAKTKRVGKDFTKEQKKAAEEHFKSLDAEVKSAADAADKTRKELSKLTDKAKAAAERAEAHRRKLEDARTKRANKSGGRTSASDVNKAAKKAGVEPEDGKAVPLKSLADAKEAIKSLVLLSGTKYPKTRAIGEAIQACFAGTITDGQLHIAVARACGEMEMPKTAAPPAPAAGKPKSKK